MVAQGTEVLSTGVKAVITAGGTSERFGSNKLLEKLGDKTVIQTTVEKFLQHVEEIIIPASDEVKNHILECFKDSRIKFAAPGATRQKSVFNALKECGSCEYVLIHDGARAYISEELILKSIRQVKLKKAIVVGISAVDTIKVCDMHKRIVETPKREYVYHAQTPQAFVYKEILDAHKKLENLDFTDDASMLEHLGKDVYIVEGEVLNIKITTRKDLI